MRNNLNPAWSKHQDMGMGHQMSGASKTSGTSSRLPRGGETGYTMPKLPSPGVSTSNVLGERSVANMLRRGMTLGSQYYT